MRKAKVKGQHRWVCSSPAGRLRDTCFDGTVFKHMFDHFQSTMVEHRWNSVVHFLREVLPLRGPLQQHWDISKFAFKPVCSKKAVPQRPLQATGNVELDEQDDKKAHQSEAKVGYHAEPYQSDTCNSSVGGRHVRLSCTDVGMPCRFWISVALFLVTPGQHPCLAGGFCQGL